MNTFRDFVLQLEASTEQSEATPLQPISEDVVDTVTMDIPLLIRILEFAREEAHNDIDIHALATNLIKHPKKVLSIKEYKDLVRGV